MNELSVELKGSAELQRKLRALGTSALKVAAGSLYRSAEAIMTLSKDKYVPVDTGNLKASGHVELPQIEGSQITVVLGYGGPAGARPTQSHSKDVGYAVHVHENPNARHTVGQWKYLETPLKAGVPDIIRELKDSIEEAFKAV
jgi:hypothetical protein